MCKIYFLLVLWKHWIKENIKYANKVVSQPRNALTLQLELNCQALLLKQLQRSEGKDYVIGREITTIRKIGLDKDISAFTFAV